MYSCNFFSNIDYTVTNYNISFSFQRVSVQLEILEQITVQYPQLLFWTSAKLTQTVLVQKNAVKMVVVKCVLVPFLCHPIKWVDVIENKDEIAQYPLPSNWKRIREDETDSESNRKEHPVFTLPQKFDKIEGFVTIGSAETYFKKRQKRYEFRYWISLQKFFQLSIK